MDNDTLLQLDVLEEVEEIRKNPDNFKTYSNLSEILNEIEEEDGEYT